MSEILIPKKNIVLDASTLSAFMSCARMGDFQYNMNLIPMAGKSNSLEVGSIIHKVLEVFYQNQINGFSRAQSIQMGMAAGEMYIRGCAQCIDFEAHCANDSSHKGFTLDNLCVECHSITVQKPLCGHQPNEYPGVVNTPMENQSKPQRTGWKWALETVEQYFDYYKNDYWVPLEVEKVRGKVLYEDDEIRILWKAKLDLLVDTNQGIKPVDHKTMKQNRDAVSLNNQFIGQCLVTDNRSVIIDRIGLQSSMEPKDKFVREIVSYTIDRLIEWQSEILPYYCKMMLMWNETGHYPANFTHCENKFGWCSFKEVCESNPNMREHELRQNFKVGPVWNPENYEG